MGDATPHCLHEISQRNLIPSLSIQLGEAGAAGNVSSAQSFLQNPYYFMFASLAKPDDDAELHWLKVCTHPTYYIVGLVVLPRCIVVFREGFSEAINCVLASSMSLWLSPLHTSEAAALCPYVLYVRSLAVLPYCFLSFLIQFFSSK
jgi:hypothetical protein